MMNAGDDVMDETEEELRRERENSDRLAAALATALACLNRDDDLRHVVIGPILGRGLPQLTVGHVVDGALGLHHGTVKARTQL
jgi:hypothetical protein